MNNSLDARIQLGIQKAVVSFQLRIHSIESSPRVECAPKGEKYGNIGDFRTGD